MSSGNIGFASNQAIARQDLFGGPMYHGHSLAPNYQSYQPPPSPQGFVDARLGPEQNGSLDALLNITQISMLGQPGFGFGMEEVLFFRGRERLHKVEITACPHQDPDKIQAWYELHIKFAFSLWENKQGLLPQPP